VDTLFRGRRLVLAAAVGAAVGGCRAEPGAPVGISAPRAVADSTRGTFADASAGAASPVTADFRSHMTRVSERIVSHGHADRFDGVVWANDVARAAWEPTGDMPDGAVLVEEAIERTPKGDRPAGLLVMVKHGTMWRFHLVDEHNHVVDGAREAACASCHTDAPRDFVFRAESTPVAPVASTAAAPAANKDGGL
jgi:hypothetical protein